jgi:hypothetical protein
MAFVGLNTQTAPNAAAPIPVGKNQADPLLRYEDFTYYTDSIHYPASPPEERDIFMSTKTIPEGSILFTYFEHNFNANAHLGPELQELAFLCNIVRSYAAQSIWFDHSNLNHGNPHLPPNVVDRVYFCLSKNQTKFKYYYPLPGPSFGVWRRFNLALMVRAKRDLCFSYAKSGANTIPQNIVRRKFPVENNPDFDPTRFTTCERLGVACDRGNPYDVCMEKEYAYEKHLDGVTAIAGEDAIVSMNAATRDIGDQKVQVRIINNNYEAITRLYGNNPPDFVKVGHSLFYSMFDIATEQQDGGHILFGYPEYSCSPMGYSSYGISRLHPALVGQYGLTEFQHSDHPVTGEREKTVYYKDINNVADIQSIKNFIVNYFLAQCPYEFVGLISSRGVYNPPGGLLGAPYLPPPVPAPGDEEAGEEVHITQARLNAYIYQLLFNRVPNLRYNPNLNVFSSRTIPARNVYVALRANNPAGPPVYTYYPNSDFGELIVDPANLNNFMIRKNIIRFFKLFYSQLDNKDKIYSISTTNNANILQNYPLYLGPFHEDLRNRTPANIFEILTNFFRAVGLGNGQGLLNGFIFSILNDYRAQLMVQGVNPFNNAMVQLGSRETFVRIQGDQVYQGGFKRKRKTVRKINKKVLKAKKNKKTRSRTK